MINRIIFGLMLVFGIGFFFTAKKMVENKNDKIRMTQNYQKLEDNNKKLILTSEELNQSQEELIKQLSDSLDIKPKFIERVVTIHTVDTIRDTVYTELVKVDSNKFDFIKDTACFHIEGTLYQDSLNPILFFTNLEYKNEINYIVYLQRKQWEFLCFKSRLFGQKEAKLETISTCGESSIEDIEIIKK